MPSGSIQEHRVLYPHLAIALGIVEVNQGLARILAIPVVIGFGSAWFNAQQGKVSDRENTDNQRATALQAGIDKMSELLFKEDLGELKSEYEEVRKMHACRR